MIKRRRLLACAAALAAVLPAVAPALAQDSKEVNFGIISTESSSNLKTIWLPLLADMEKQTGLKVNPFFASDYAGVIEAMRFNKVQVAWYGNAAAIQAVDRAEGEIFAQVVAKDGALGYWSLLIVHKDSPLNSLADMMKQPGQLTFGNGDPNSTSGFLVPSFYVFAQNKIDQKTFFKRVVSAGHEANALAVANKQVDVATNNTENVDRLKLTAPERHDQIKVIWKSPLIPSDPILWRKDLPAEARQKLKAFMVGYAKPRPGVPAAEVEREKQVMAPMPWAGFQASSNAQLVPIRELALFRDRIKIEADGKLSAAEKEAKLREIDEKLAQLKKASGA